MPGGRLSRIFCYTPFTYQKNQYVYLLSAFDLNRLRQAKALEINRNLNRLTFRKLSVKHNCIAPFPYLRYIRCITQMLTSLERLNRVSHDISTRLPSWRKTEELGLMSGSTQYVQVEMNSHRGNNTESIPSAVCLLGCETLVDVPII